MAESANVGFAHRISERHENGAPPGRSRELLEIVEVAILAIVAIATAWSGYQAARWDGQQALEYGTATRLHVQSGEAATLGGQQKLLDVSTFNTWIQARQEGNTKLANLYVRRFSPEYRVAFDAWLKLQPFRNSHVPPGPSFMPEYHNPQNDLSVELEKQADVEFELGTSARETADRYVRQTVVLATVLFLVAVAQRFRFRAVRIAAIVIAGGLMAFAVWGVATLPRI